MPDRSLTVDYLLIDMKAVASLIGASVPTVRRMTAARAIPQPRTLPGRRVMRWLRSDIESWIAALPAAR
ncbi:helix-turn-helix transcriptional regulator [Paeniroseomonas aquatica]|uniref:helix-turn-helix transcriptional regulator n=2 Tax=Paeniroseomonas aquatica TaxID=373043 RepID=UPI0038D055E6